MNQAQVDQLQAGINEDLTSLIDLMYSAAIWRSEGEHEKEAMLVNTYVEVLGSLTKEHLVLLFDRTLNMVTAQFALEDGREDLLLEPPVSLDELPPLD